jgi:chromosome segregation ATPase
VENDKLFDLMSKMYSEMQDMKTEMQDMKTEMQDVKTEVKDIKSDMQGVKGDLKEVNKKLDDKADKTDIVRLEDTLAEKLGGLFDARELQLDSKAHTDSVLERIESKLDHLNVDVSFLGHRERETEKTVYSIQKHLEIIK